MDSFDDPPDSRHPSRDPCGLAACGYIYVMPSLQKEWPILQNKSTFCRIGQLMLDSVELYVGLQNAPNSAAFSAERGYSAESSLILQNRLVWPDCLSTQLCSKLACVMMDVRAVPEHGDACFV